MAIKTKAKAKETEKQVFDLDIEVTRAIEIEDKDVIMFDMIANHVIIKGCSYKVLTNETTGEEFAKVGFPSKKGKDDKWYTEVYFGISPETLQKIEEGIKAKLGE